MARLPVQTLQEVCLAGRQGAAIGDRELLGGLQRVHKHPEAARFPGAFGLVVQASG